MRWQDELKARMEEKDGSVTAFARRADLNRTQVENYLSSDDVNPTLATLRKIASRLECRVADVLPPADRSGAAAPHFSRQEMAGLELARALSEPEFHYIARLARDLKTLQGQGTRPPAPRTRTRKTG